LGFRVIDDRAWVMLSAALFSCLYLTFFYLKAKGQTIGSKVFGIKVITIDGSDLGFWRALLRSILISGIVSPLGFVSVLGFSFILFSLLSLSLRPTKQRRQTFWDAATKTCVVKGGSRLKLTKWQNLP